MTFSSIRRHAVLSAAILGLAACGDGGNQQPTQAVANIEACSLLTAAEVGEAIGKPVGDGQADTPVGGGAAQGRMTTCTWSTPPPADPIAPGVMANARVVTFIAWSWPVEGNGAEGFIQAFRDLPVLGTPAPVAVSLGDEALWAGGGLGPIGGTLHVRSGDVTFSITVSALSGGNSEAQPQSERLAAIVLGRL